MAFTWTTVVLLFLSALGFLSSYLAHRHGRDRDSVRHAPASRSGRFTNRIHRQRDGSEEYYTKAQESGIKPDDRASYETSESQRHFLNRDGRVGENGRGYEGGGYIGAEEATGRT